MKISTKAFKHLETIPTKYTADGENINPELQITNIPKNTKTLTLICDDPDAKKICGFTWIHWLIFNIPTNKEKIVIQENSIPGKSGDSSYHKDSYGGPNPPAGTGIHNYHFKIYALDTELNLQKNASLEEINNAMQNHILDNCEIIGTYQRK